MERSRSLTVAEIAGIVGATVAGDGSVVVTGLASINDAGPGDLTFLANPRYEKFLDSTGASAIIVPAHYDGSPLIEGRTVLLADDAYVAFAAALAVFDAGPETIAPGIDPGACVADTAVLADGVSVGPCAVIMGGASIGARTVIHAGAYVGANSTVGDDCIILPNATIKRSVTVGDRVYIHSGTVLGSDGFGFAWDGQCHRKVPQIGTVIVADDVEIGANACIDRATIGATRIGRGTKIDNLVQIAHNVEIGESSIVVAQVGISGSTRVGSGVVLAGQAGIAGHIEIGDRAVVAAQAGVMGDVPAGENVSGYPALKHSLSKRLHAGVRNLPAMFKRIREIERRLDDLDKEV